MSELKSPASRSSAGTPSGSRTGTKEATGQCARLSHQSGSEDVSLSEISLMHLAEAGPKLGPILCPSQQGRTFLVVCKGLGSWGLAGWGGPFPHPFTSRVRVGLSRMMSLSTTTSASSGAWHTAVVRIMLSAFRYFSY